MKEAPLDAKVPKDLKFWAPRGLGDFAGTVRPRPKRQELSKLRWVVPRSRPAVLVSAVFQRGLGGRAPRPSPAGLTLGALLLWCVVWGKERFEDGKAGSTLRL